MSSTRVSCHVNAPRDRVYRALIDPDSIGIWMVPDGMSSTIHEHDGREGGAFRISLTYDDPSGTGKTSAHTDTYHGRYLRLVPGELVVETVEFESDDPDMQGEMTITFQLSDAGSDAGGGTDVSAVHDALPKGLSPADNELGWRLSLAKLVALVEAG